MVLLVPTVPVCIIPQIQGELTYGQNDQLLEHWNAPRLHGATGDIPNFNSWSMKFENVWVISPHIL